jgi:hypothetical protein
MSNSNFLKDLEEVIGEETVEAVVFTSLMDTQGWPPNPEPRNAGIIAGKRYTWEEAKPLLDYSYYCGHGPMDCHEVNIWTSTRVIYTHEYDGSTWPDSAPRNPPAE